MPGYKADGTIVPDTPRDPNAKPPKLAGGQDKTPPTPEDLRQIHQRRVEAAQGRGVMDTLARMVEAQELKENPFALEPKRPFSDFGRASPNRWPR